MRTLLLIIAITALSSLRAADTLYISSFLDGSITRIDPTGAKSTAVSGLAYPYGLAVDAGGNLYIACGYTNRIWYKTPGGTLQSAARGAFADGNTALALSRAGRLVVANQSANAVTEFAFNGTGRLVTAQLDGPFGLAYDAAGILYVAHTGPNFTGGYISTLAPNGAISRIASGLHLPRGIAFDHLGNLYIANYGSGEVVKLDPSGQRTVLASGLGGPSGLAFASDGSLLVVEESAGAVSRIPPGQAPIQIVTGLAMPLYIAVHSDTPASVELYREPVTAVDEPVATLVVRGPTLSYQEVQGSTDLGSWEPLGIVQIPGGGPARFRIASAEADSARFYRTQILR